MMDKEQKRSASHSAATVMVPRTDPPRERGLGRRTGESARIAERGDWVGGRVRAMRPARETGSERPQGTARVRGWVTVNARATWDTGRTRKAVRWNVARAPRAVLLDVS
jgi:hypothetical protein